MDDVLYHYIKSWVIIHTCPYFRGRCFRHQYSHSSNSRLIQIVYYSDVIMSAMASQITSLTIVYSTTYSGKDQRKHKSSASLVFVRGIHRWPVNSPAQRPMTRKMFPLDDVIMLHSCMAHNNHYKHSYKSQVWIRVHYFNIPEGTRALTI